MKKQSILSALLILLPLHTFASPHIISPEEYSARNTPPQCPACEPRDCPSLPPGNNPPRECPKVECPVPPTPPSQPPTPKVCEVHRFEFKYVPVHGKNERAFISLDNAKNLSCIHDILKNPASHIVWEKLLEKVGSVPGGSDQAIYKENQRYIECTSQLPGKPVGTYGSPRADKHNGHRMIGGSNDPGNKGTKSPGCAQGNLFLNDNCEMQIANEAKNKLQSDQCKVRYTHELGTPISLIWDTKYKEIPSTITHFKLNPYSDKDTWLWRGSSALPLLVYDPEHNGNIVSAEQLFGSWTFGGKGHASLSDAPTSNTPWTNGFEALSQMDKNHDSKISDEELAPLGVWFDNNQNGISEKGEVISAEELGLKSLYLTIDKKESKDLIVSHGFEIETKNEKRVGALIDWSEKSIHEGLLDTQVLKINHGSTVEEKTNNTSNTSKNKNSVLSGGWKFELSAPAEGSGILSFDVDEYGNVMGTNYTVIGINNLETISNKLSFTHFDVDTLGDSEKNIEILFSYTLESGAKLINKAKLDETGNILSGKTIVKNTTSSEQGSYEYSWKAYRIAQ